MEGGQDGHEVQVRAHAGLRYRYIYLPIHKNPEEKALPVLNRDYNPPHLLGLLRYYSVGRSSYTVSSSTIVQPKPKNRSVSVSALGLTRWASRSELTRPWSLLTWASSRKEPSSPSSSKRPCPWTVTVQATLSTWQLWSYARLKAFQKLK
jgi:hypothetical protein